MLQVDFHSIIKVDYASECFTRAKLRAESYNPVVLLGEYRFDSGVKVYYVESELAGLAYYEVQIWAASGQDFAFCDCAARGLCKHIAAALKYFNGHAYCPVKERGAALAAKTCQFCEAPAHAFTLIPEDKDPVMCREHLDLTNYLTAVWID